VGIVLAVINFARILIMQQASVWVAATVSFSMIITVILAKVIGGSFPILAKKIGLDPAIMAGPLITTIVDALALTAYFSIASWILGI